MKTEKQKVLEGTNRSDRPSFGSLEDAFPGLDRLPKAPDYFNDNQKKVFRDITRLLLETGKLSKVDSHNLEMLAVYICQFRMATEKLQDEDNIINKHSQVSGWVTLQSTSAKQINTLSKQFGLSIADRNKLRNNAGKTDPNQLDAFAQHLNNHPQLKIS